MSTHQVIEKLQKPYIQQQLRQAGILHIWLFGSVARGTHTDTSDIDLVYDFDEASMQPQSWGVGGAYALLRECLGKELDMVKKKYIHHSIAHNVLSTMIPIY